ncbi:gliding motility-associated C-terminal domain-containing protein [Fibrella sp. HMF5405]|uniref:Gliding motility-associated C-terminal domain-containing protein n=2 Tax=Fibrella forsythiae TaxID=2817061 RepID=A0ABS3JIP5_9BACT|nr:gliding motility-associated C-terminal domain-containing protein [Fibrella forsythiae]
MGQELIPNGSFEKYQNCPRQDNLLEEAVPWYNPNLATPDFYNQCFPTNQIEVPPRTGVGLARLFLDQGWAEYLATPLTKPLEAAKCYYFEMYVSSRNPNQYIAGTIGAHFSNQPLTSTAKSLLFAKPQVLDAQASTVSGSFKWDKISGTFEAKGGERFVTIGSFNKLPAMLAFYYVFIDDVSLVPIELNLGNDTTLCGRKSTYLLNAKTPGATDYRWNDGNTSPTYLVTKPGKYWVTVTTPCKILSDTIVVDYALNFTLGRDTTLCNAQSLTLRGPANAPNYRWQDGSGQPSFQVAQNGTYSLRISQAGCVVTDTIRVSFIKPPQLDLGPNRELCGAEVYTIKPMFAEGTFAWQDAFPQTERTVGRSGTYLATVTNACTTIRDSIDIDYGECGCVVYTPDLFTPNADGLNDLFQPIACGDITLKSLSIFNRWGELIFHTQTAPFQWDGFVNGSVCMGGVYAWQIDYELQQREKISQKQKQGRLIVAY